MIIYDYQSSRCSAFGRIWRHVGMDLAQRAGKRQPKTKKAHCLTRHDASQSAGSRRPWDFGSDLKIWKKLPWRHSCLSSSDCTKCSLFSFVYRLNSMSLSYQLDRGDGMDFLQNEPHKDAGDNVQTRWSAWQLVLFFSDISQNIKLTGKFTG